VFAAPELPLVEPPVADCPPVGIAPEPEVPAPGVPPDPPVLSVPSAPVSEHPKPARAIPEMPRSNVFMGRYLVFIETDFLGAGSRRCPAEARAR
jgi:hypothetical protein